MSSEFIYRDKDVLVNGIEDIKIFLQYLYLSSEHSVTIKNAINVPLKIFIPEGKEDLYFINMNFPELPLTPFTQHMNLSSLLAVVDLIKKEPAEDANTFANRWEKIKTITLANIVQNEDKR